MQGKKKATFIARLVLASILLIATGYVFYIEVFKGKEVVAAKVGSTAPDFTLKSIRWN